MVDRETLTKIASKSLCLKIYSVHSENESLGFCSRLLGPLSDRVWINRVSKGRALHQIIKYSPGAILID